MVRDRFDEYIRFRREVVEFVAETDQVIRDLEEFPYGNIAKIINTCSTQIIGLTTSGSDQMSHNAKRIRAGEYITGAMEKILDKNHVGLTFTADSDSFDLMNRISGELDNTQLENGRIDTVLENYSMDLKSLAKHVETSRDLNINGDSDLGDTPIYELEEDRTCTNCENKTCKF